MLDLDKSGGTLLVNDRRLHLFEGSIDGAGAGVDGIIDPVTAIRPIVDGVRIELM